MKFKILFFYSGKTETNRILDFIKNNDFHNVITNSADVAYFLKRKKVDVRTFDEKIPRMGDVLKNIYQKSKKIQNEYKEIFKKINHKGIEVFRGFEYQLLLQLILIESCRIYLEEEKDVIFIFEGYSPTYFVMDSIAKTIGFENENNIIYMENALLRNHYSPQPYWHF